MATPTGRLSRRESQARTREQLLGSAAVVFGERGYECASIEEIARHAGVTTGAIYSNFAGKGDLFLALFDRQVEARVRELTDPPALSARHWMNFLSEEPQLYPLFLEFCVHAARRPELQARLAASFDRYRAAVAALVEAAARKRRAALEAGAADRMAAAIVALGNGVAVERLADPDAVPDDLYGWALQLLLDGFDRSARATSRTKP
jgi:AcrR family transcriptional regulator